MARHYYLTRAGRLRRKDNTLAFEPSGECEPVDDEVCDDSPEPAAEWNLVDGAGELNLEPEGAIEAETMEAAEMLAASEFADEDARQKPVRVMERRVIPELNPLTETRS